MTTLSAIPSMETQQYPNPFSASGRLVAQSDATKGGDFMSDHRTVAYFSMEIGLEAGMPTYSGGLGVLAGDTIRSAADLNVPLVAVTLLHRKGYFYQRLDSNGWQSEEPVEWIVEQFLEEMPQRARVRIEGRTVQIRAWRYQVKGVGGFTVPVYFLDAQLPENSEWDQTLTDSLYGGDQHYRLCQEAILGIGGVRMLRALGYESLERFHMNEGHASLLTLELAHEEARKGSEKVTRECIEAVRKKCIFTTHTPVPAGHDQFPRELMLRVVGLPEELFDVRDSAVTDLRHHVVNDQNLDQHDASRSQLQSLRERRGEETRRSVQADVWRILDRLHHQRRSCGDVGRRAVSETV